MTDPIAFALATLAILATPGPTNALLAASGAGLGPRRSLILIPAGLAGYLLVISTLLAVAQPMLAAFPQAGAALKLLAAAWLICCARRLWREEEEAAAGAISARRVFVTTLLNPKALVFALAVFPQLPLAESGPWLGAFSVMDMTVALGWVMAGALLGRSAGAFATPRRVCRAASAVLAVFAMLAAGSAIAGIL